MINLARWQSPGKRAGFVKIAKAGSFDHIPRENQQSYINNLIMILSQALHGQFISV